MDNPENALIVASRRDLPTFELNTSAKEAKTKALENAALIAKVSNGDSKTIAVRAQVELKRVLNALEKARKELKEPILEAGRKLDTLVAAESLELEKEFGRVSNAVKEFDDSERRRVIEEERLQREELARIEREKQAELDRIRREQEAREAAARKLQEEAERKVREIAEAAQRKAREEREAAEKLAREATNKKQREAAEKARKEAEQRAEVARIEAQQAAERARIERERQEAFLREEAAKAAAQSAVIEEKAGDAAYCAAKPVEITRVQGQRTTCDWEITKINDWALLKARPDLVRKIEFDMRLIKDELRRGVSLPGVDAKEVYKADVRVGSKPKAIDV